MTAAALPIPDSQAYVLYQVTASTTGPFAVPFPLPLDFASALKVEVDGVALESDDYTFTADEETFAGYPSGSITLANAVANADVAVFRDTPLIRTSDYAQGPLDYDGLNAELARLTMQVQDARLAAALNRLTLDPDESFATLTAFTALEARVGDIESDMEAGPFANAAATTAALESATTSIGDLETLTANLSGPIAAAIAAALADASSDLAAFVANSTNGFYARTGAGAIAARTIIGTANEITVANGNGVSGNPSLSLPASLTFTGKTITGGAFVSPTSITGLPSPTSATDAATKGYVDGVSAGLQPKSPVLAATAANITLSGEQTIDDVALVAGDRVLVKDQSAPAQNGIYVVAGGAWSRATDMDTWAEAGGALVFVSGGTANADKGFIAAAPAGGTLGTTAIMWTLFASSGSYQPRSSTLDVYATLGAPSSDVQDVLNAANASAIRTALDLVIGTNVQAHSANLTTFAGIAPSANVQTLLAAADYAAIRTALGLVIGTNVQAYHALLAALAASSPSAGDVWYAASSTTMSKQASTAFGRGLLNLADAAALRSAAGLGTASTQNTGQSGDSIAKTNGTNTWNNRQTIAGTRYGEWSAANTDIDGLSGGSTFGTLIEGRANGHFTFTLRENDSDDEWQWISGGGNYGTDSIYDTMAMRLSHSGLLRPAIGVELPNTGLQIRDTNASHVLTIAPSSNLTANRTFSLATGDANRSLDISASDVTISAAAATLLDDANIAAMQATLLLAPGVNVQAYSAVLSLFGAVSLTGNASKFLRVNGGETGVEFATVGGGGDALTSAPLSQFAATTSAQLAGVISDETGTGALVFANSPTLVTPALGTPASGLLTNCTGLPVASGISGLASGVATFLATPTSANLRAALTDEVGTGAAYFVGGALGTPASGTMGATSVTSTGSTTPRTLAARFAERRNIADYGATTASSDNRTAVNAAIAANNAASGGIIYIPEGNWQIDLPDGAGLTGFAANTRIIGAGRYRSTLTINCTTSTYLNAFGNSGNIIFEDIRIIFNVVSGQTASLIVMRSNMEFYGVDFVSNMAVVADAIDRTSVLLNVPESGTYDRLVMDDCTWTGWGYPIIRTNTSTTVLTDTRLRNCRAWDNGICHWEFNAPLGSWTGIRVKDFTMGDQNGAGAGLGFGLGFASTVDAIAEGIIFRGTTDGEAMHIEEGVDGFHLRDFHVTVTSDESGEGDGIQMLNNNIGGVQKAPMNWTVTNGIIRRSGAGGGGSYRGLWLLDSTSTTPLTNGCIDNVIISGFTTDEGLLVQTDETSIETGQVIVS